MKCEKKESYGELSILKEGGRLPQWWTLTLTIKYLVSLKEELFCEIMSCTT